MRSTLYMAWRYLAHHKVKSAILVISIALIIFLPVGLKIIVEQSATSLTTRAETTPLVIGAKGSPLELVLNTLYFESEVPATLPFSQSTRISSGGLATAIPVHTRFRAGKQPIVGTTLDYFEFRGLQVSAGRNLTQLGDCVLGAEAAKASGLSPGDTLISSPEGVFDLAGVYPLKMHVVGVLAPNQSPDDTAVFVDVKTAWIIEGLAHGHQDLAKPEAASGVLKRDGNRIVGNASVMEYREINPNNLDSFHFHGDPETYPITAIIAVPHDPKSSAMLQGKYLGSDERMQVVNPVSVMDDLLDTILAVRAYAVTAVSLVGLSTVALAILVFLLSLRLRRHEISTMRKIGGSHLWIFSILSAEIVTVILLGAALAAVATLLTRSYGAEIIRQLIF